MRDKLWQARVWIIAVALIVVSAAAMAPQLVQLRHIQREISGLEQRLDDSRAVTEGLSGLARQVSALHQQVDGIDKIIPDQTAQGDLIRELGLHIESEQLRDQELQTRDVVLDERYARLPVELNFRGDSPAAFRFVRRIEQMPHLVHVNLLRIKPAPGTDGLVDVMMNVEAFFTAPGDPS